MITVRFTVADMHDSYGNVTLQAATLVSDNQPPTAAHPVGQRFPAGVLRTELRQQAGFIEIQLLADQHAQLAPLQLVMGLGSGHVDRLPFPLAPPETLSTPHIATRPPPPPPQFPRREIL